MRFGKNEPADVDSNSWGSRRVIRIGIDRQTFIIQKHGGISRYFTDLYLGLMKAADINVKLLFKYHQNDYLRDCGIGRTIRPFQATAYIKAMKILNSGIGLSEHVDIQHSTYYLGCPKKGNSGVRLVSTLHDMTPELIPKYFNGKQHANKIEWLRESDLIISVSDTSAADLAYLHPELAGKICRIHLYSGFDPTSHQSKPMFINYQNPYFLYVGHRGSYKNTTLLLRAFANSQPAIHGHKLLFAGGGSLNLREKEEIDRQKLSTHVAQVGVSDPELWYLYRNASAVLVPSLAEGFSLPLVEGLAADVPVICSDIPVHREIAKDYARLINPLLHDDWADALRANGVASKPSSVLGMESYRKKLNYFSRERMLDQHAKAYKDLMG